MVQDPGVSVEFFRFIINLLPVFGAAYLLFGLISDRNRDIQGGFMFSLLMLSAAVYTFAYYFEVHSFDLDTAFMYLSIEYIGLSFIGSLWVLFIMEYTGILMQYRRYIAPFLIIISFSTLTIVNTNPFHELYYINLSFQKIHNLSIVSFERGPWYWFFVIYTNLCFLAGNLLLLYACCKKSDKKQKRYLLLFVGSFFPWIALMLNVTTRYYPKIDYGPFGLIIAAIIFIYNVYAYKLFDLIPAAKKTVFDSMQDGVLILNTENRITEVNKAAVKLLGRVNIRYGVDLSALFDGDTAVKILNRINSDNELICSYKKNEDEILLDIRASKILDKSGQYNGILLILRDVTLQKADEEEIRHLLQEKEILLREVHHRIKNNMNTIAGFLTLQARNLDNKVAISALQEAKNKISGMMMIYDQLMFTNDFTNISSSDYLNQLIDYITSTYENRSKIRVIKEIDNEILDSKIMFQLGMIVNELLTNSYKYAFNDNNNGEIVIRFRVKNSKAIELIYRDNGNIFPEQNTLTVHTSGLGLNLVNLLVRQLKGKIEIERKDGTEFRIELPGEKG